MRMMIPSVKSYCFVLLFLFVASCGAGVQSTNADTAGHRITSTSKTIEGEQAEIVQRYGVPDQIRSVGMGVVSWTYCAKSTTPVHIQFDRDGAVMNRFSFGQSSCHSFYDH